MKITIEFIIVELISELKIDKKRTNTEGYPQQLRGYHSVFLPKKAYSITFSVFIFYRFKNYTQNEALVLRRQISTIYHPTV